MRPSRFEFARFSSIGITLCLCLCLGLLGAGGVLADPVPANEQSLGNGALLYDLYCSDCHGRALGDRTDALDETHDPDDYTALIDIALGSNSPATTTNPAEEEWPEWADPPDPDQVEVIEPDIRADVLGVVTAVIDEAHGIKPESDRLVSAGGIAETNKKSGFSPVPGTTNLSAPQTFFYGTSEEELFNSIANGTGAAMPGWRTELGSDDAIWDVVNYIRSFWGEEWLY